MVKFWKDGICEHNVLEFILRDKEKPPQTSTLTLTSTRRLMHKNSSTNAIRRTMFSSLDKAQVTRTLVQGKLSCNAENIVDMNEQ